MPFTLRRWEGALLPETVTLERVKHRSTHAVIDSLQLSEASVVGFLKGELRAGEVAKVWRSQVRALLQGPGFRTLNADPDRHPNATHDPYHNPYHNPNANRGPRRQGLAMAGAGLAVGSRVQDPRSAARVWRSQVQPWPTVLLTVVLVRVQGQSEAMIRVTAQLFDDIQSVIESKQLAPMLRTQVSRRLKL